MIAKQVRYRVARDDARLYCYAFDVLDLLAPGSIIVNVHAVNVHVALLERVAEHAGSCSASRPDDKRAIRDFPLAGVPDGPRLVAGRNVLYRDIPHRCFVCENPIALCVPHSHGFIARRKVAKTCNLPEVEGRQVQGRERRAVAEHGAHVRHGGGVEGRQVQGRELGAAVEHGDHARHCGGIE